MARKSTGGSTPCSCSPTSPRPTGCRTRRTRCCRAGTTSAATWARWSPRCWASSAPSSPSASGGRGASAMPEHFVAPPRWEWYIVWYFYLGGIAGGAYALGAILRLLGDRRDEGVARAAFLTSFPVLAICPIVLTLDLGRPTRFWHMMLNSRTLEPSVKYWSPMSVGVWIVLIFGAFSAVSFVEALVLDGRLRHPLLQRLTRRLSGGVSRLFTAVGACFGLGLAGYTGVLLSVSNQPVWSDTWALGGLFLASGLSAAAAAIALTARLRCDAEGAEAKLSHADRYFILLELGLLV